MNYPCNLIRDLLPLYHDGVCSSESALAVSEHLESCPECREVYRSIRASDAMENAVYDAEQSRRVAESYRQVRKKERRKIALIVAAALLGWLLLIGGAAVGLFYWDSATAKVEVCEDISEYARYRSGEQADPRFRSKWGMDESIFPEEITPEMNAESYRMVYYDPFDAQFLGYLVVSFEDPAAYQAERERLAECGTTDYLGNYSVTGFSEYELLAMYADDYYGFVYALADGEDRIVYVELIFCNYFLDVDAAEYIPEAYLPDGFDASRGNPYRQEQMRTHG